MKKFITALCLFFLLPIICVVSGCNTLNNNNGWTEVQSITYTTENGSTTLTSECVWDYERVEIEKSEYDSAPDDQKVYILSLQKEINIDRNEFIRNANEKVEKTYYSSLNNPGSDIQYPYYKTTVNSYTLNYVKVKFVSDSVLEINFKGEQKRVNTLTYDVTYFKN